MSETSTSDRDMPFGNGPLRFHENNDREEENSLRWKCRCMRHDLFYLWVFLASEDMLSEAMSFLEDHEEDTFPLCLY